LVRHDTFCKEAHTDKSKGLTPRFEHALPHRSELLLHHHLPRLQCPAFPPPHRAPTGASRCNCDPVVRIIIRFQHVDPFRASFVGGRKVAEERLNLALAEKRGLATLGNRDPQHSRGISTSFDRTVHAHSKLGAGTTLQLHLPSATICSAHTRLTGIRGCRCSGSL
jgi:hypothetical protein